MSRRGRRVFVDDAEVNVRAAKTLAMRDILYRVDRGQDLAALLAELGVRPDGLRP